MLDISEHRTSITSKNDPIYIFRYKKYITIAFLKNNLHNDYLNVGLYL